MYKGYVDNFFSLGFNYNGRFNTMGLRGKQNIFQISDFMALGSSFRYDYMPLSIKRL